MVNGSPLMNLLRRAWVVHQLRRHFYKWDRQTLERHQRQRVDAMLAFVGEHSPYYASLLDRKMAFEDLPVIDKAIMMAHFDEINTAGLVRDPLVAFKINQERAGNMDLFASEYSIGLSSGTSGNRGLTVLSKAERELYGCLLWARSGIPKAIRPLRLLFTLRTNNAAFWEPRSFGVKLVFADYTHPAADLIKIINDKDINVLAGPPSLLRMVAAEADALLKPLRALISYAEVLDPETEATLRHRLGAPVIQIYQCSEGFIASTCSAGNLHINEDVILVQLEKTDDPQDRVKSVILTDLYRMTQPIIRYRLGDLLELDPEPCPCGSCFRRIKVIHGRSDDIFHLRGQDGRIRYLFPDYVRRAINQASGDIVEFQAIQHSYELIEIRLLTAPAANRQAIEAQIVENLRWRADAVGGELGRLCFNCVAPESNPGSKKLIRVVRRF